MSGGKLIDARTAALLEYFFLAPPFFTILPVTVFTTVHHIGEYVWFLSEGHGRSGRSGAWSADGSEFVYATGEPVWHNTPLS